MPSRPIQLSATQKAHCRFRLPIELACCDLDRFGQLSSDAVLRFMDRSRVESIEQLTAELGRESWLTTYTVNVYKIDLALFPTPLEGNVSVRTGIRKTTTHRAAFDQLVVVGDDLLVAEATVEVLFLDGERKLAPAPEELPEVPGYAPSRPLAPAVPPIPFTHRDHFSYERTTRVYYEDTDTQGITYHVAYFRLFERALSHFVGAADVEQLKALPRAARQTIRYMNASALGEHLLIHLGARRLDETRMVVDARIESAETGKLTTDASFEFDLSGSPALQAKLSDLL